MDARGDTGSVRTTLRLLAALVVLVLSSPAFAEGPDLAAIARSQGTPEIPGLKMVVSDEHIQALQRAKVDFVDITKRVPNDSAPVQSS